MNEFCDFFLVEKKIIPILFGIQLDKGLFNLSKIFNSTLKVSQILVSKKAQGRKKSQKTNENEQTKFIIEFLKNFPDSKLRFKQL